MWGVLGRRQFSSEPHLVPAAVDGIFEGVTYHPTPIGGSRLVQAKPHPLLALSVLVSVPSPPSPRSGPPKCSTSA